MYPGGGDILFDNSGTDLSSTNIQDAIVEVNGKIKSNVTFSPNTGVELVNSSIVKTGNAVSGSIEIRVTGNQDSWVNLGSISSAPTAKTTFPVVKSGDGSHIGMIEIATTGVTRVYIKQALSGSSVTGCFSYMS